MDNAQVAEGLPFGYSCPVHGTRIRLRERSIHTTVVCPQPGCHRYMLHPIGAGTSGEGTE